MGCVSNTLENFRYCILCLRVLTILKQNWWFIKRSRLQSTQDGDIFKGILMRKRQNGKCDVRKFCRCFFRMSSVILTFKIHVFSSDFDLNCSKLILAVDVPSQMLLCILFSIDHLQGVNSKSLQRKLSVTNWYVLQNW